MKIVVAHNRYISGSPSGENQAVDRQISSLRAAGLEVVPYVRSSDEIAGMRRRDRAVVAAGAIASPSALRDLRKIFSEQRPDVLHLHNPYPLISPAVVRLAHEYAIPVVQSVHNFRHR